MFEEHLGRMGGISFLSGTRLFLKVHHERRKEELKPGIRESD